MFLRKTNQNAVGDARRDDRAHGKIYAAKILVIDDDPAVRQFLRDSLAAFGYEVNEAENGPNGFHFWNPSSQISQRSISRCPA